MGIDEANATDALHRGLERGAGAGAAERADPVRTDPEWRAATARLYRVLVEHVYGKTHDAWTRALPDLRALWEKQEEKFTERTRPSPRSQPDGSWVADGDRRLTPDQNAEATRACAYIRDRGERVILPAMERIEAADPGRRLAGLEHMIKGEDRLKEKIADYLQEPDVTISEAINRVPDAVRFTFTYSPQRYAEGIRADVDRMKAEGFELVKLKNLWTDDQYKGVNSQWHSPKTGLGVEVQFHTAESLEAKELTHKAYERIRGSISPAEHQELASFQRQVNALLTVPDGTVEIEDFPERR